MKDLTKVFIDLSKCSEEQRKHIFSLLPPTKTNSLEIFEESVYLHYIEYWGKWVVDDILCIYNKTELTYPEFIKLFEGGEGENSGWIKIESEADLPKEKGNYFVFTVDKSIETIYVDGDISVMQHTSHSWIRHFTHYQPIIKPEPPKF